MFTAGNKAGEFYTVTANDVSTLTLDLNGDTIDGTSGAGVVSGDTFQLIPYWTLNTLFPNQAGITGTTFAAGGGSNTKVLFANVVNPGTNNPASSPYFYYTGTVGGGPCWRQEGQATTNFNDQVLPPDQCVIIRQDGLSASTNLTVNGVVPFLPTKYNVGTLAANTAQDNPLAIATAVPMTLAQSGLASSSAFTGATGAAGQGGDEILIYNETLALENKPASFEYFYFTGTTGGGPSWRQVGQGTANMNNQVAFQPGSGFIIRKLAQPAPSTSTWTVTPPYLTP